MTTTGINMKSEQINELAIALTRVQIALGPAHKNKKNPFFKSDYADLVAVWDSCRKELATNGLCVIQTTDVADDGSADLITTLAHSSGQWISGRYPLKAIKQDPQGIGSAMTYARRYALMAIVGIVTDDDDDGEQAMGRHAQTQSRPTPPPPKHSDDDFYQGSTLPFIPPVTPKMKAAFEKNEAEDIKRQLEATLPQPERPVADDNGVYVNGNTLIMFGKNKGKTFSELDADTLGKSLWAAEKGIKEGAEWVDKMGVDHVEQFAQQARAYLNRK
jgi:ERF superfamily